MTQESQNVSDELNRLLESCLSLMLATVNERGDPLASYAPYVRDDDGDFYVYVSGLSSHTSNLLQQRRASILIAQDERDTPQIFARLRANFDCEAELIARDTPAWSSILERFQMRFGNVTDILRQLADFTLIRLHPRKGTFIRGFGQAYRWNEAGLEQIRPQPR